jgi:hypothetical protein
MKSYAIRRKEAEIEACRALEAAYVQLNLPGNDPLATRVREAAMNLQRFAGSIF